MRKRCKLLEGKITRSTERAGGYDVYALHDTIIPARGRAIVETGVRLALHENFVALFSHRSGINFKNGQIHPLGIIDADFKEKEHFIRANFYNMTDEDFTIKTGERVAQIVVVEHWEIEEAEELGNTRTGGFGSTGK